MRLRGFAFALICCLLAGCATRKTPIATDGLQRGTFISPQLLYILDSPYRKMFVEVDAVRGAEPDDATLKQVHDFFATYCAKPDGIEIVRGPVIPRAMARQFSPETLACKVVKGPPGTNCAFLQILFYDGAAYNEPATTEPARRNMIPSTQPRVRERNPQTEFLPYPSVILFNKGYTIKKDDELLLRHELGHALGLVTRTNDVDARHCTDPHCLMYKWIHIHLPLYRVLIGRSPIEVEKQELCPKCLKELADETHRPPPRNLRFAGPVFVRTEDGYQVLSLPMRTRVILGDVTDEDCRTFVQDCAKSSGDEELYYNIKPEIVDQPKLMETLLQRAGKDPFSGVRHITAIACQRLKKPELAAEICRNSLRLDKEETWSKEMLTELERSSPANKPSP